jgi:hypothetical protein
MSIPQPELQESGYVGSLSVPVVGSGIWVVDEPSGLSPTVSESESPSVVEPSPAVPLPPDGAHAAVARARRSRALWRRATVNMEIVA